MINLFNDDSDDDELLNQGPVFARNPAAKRPAPPPAVTPAASAVHSHHTTSTAPPPKKKKMKRPSKGFALLWISTHGKGRRSSWRKKDLKMLGVYPTKEKAEAAKQQVMSEHDCYGHGDICVGGTWEDEIDLVVRDTTLYLDDE